MTSSDWWARKLGAAPARPAPTAPPSYPATAPAAPPYVGQMPQPAQPQVTSENIAQVAGLWKGGEATKKETQKCPNCGGDHFFSIANAPGSRVATTSGMASAAPRCYDCGYTTRHGMQTGAQ